MKFSDYSHHLVIEGEMIIFDEVGDRYFLLDKLQAAQVLEDLNFGGEVLSEATLELEEKGVLVAGFHKGETRYSSEVVQALDNHEWSTAFKFGLVEVGFSSVLRSMFVLFLIKILVGALGLHKVFRIIRKAKKINCGCRVDYKRLLEISSSMKKASMYIPFRSSCLEHSIGVVLISAMYGGGAVMRIGVKNYDFLAHAWVEKDGVVVGDDPCLTKALHVIFEI
ncbi:hypothetical protein B6S59_05165 [Pseudomonas sp. A46]|nr:lasso peptide biosynthesis B2 protein [Pseudomonas sp. A46]OWJ96845.1 hypothetical protein B6S59_05165 [Pseudomonas sp. A46]